MEFLKYCKDDNGGVISLFVAKYRAFIHKFEASNNQNCAATEQPRRKTNGLRGGELPRADHGIQSGHGRYHDQTMVASITVASLCLERCALMLCLAPWSLARFGRGGMFWASFACFIDYEGLNNHSFVPKLGLKRFKSKIKNRNKQIPSAIEKIRV